MSNEAEKAALEILQIKRAKRGAPSPSLYWGTIVSVQTGPPKSLTITIGGSAVNVAGVRYSDSIATPTAGDVVRIERTGDDFYVTSRKA